MAFGALVFRNNFAAFEASDDLVPAAFRAGKPRSAAVIGNVFLAADAFLYACRFHASEKL